MYRRQFLNLLGCGCCGFFLTSCTKTPITERSQVNFYPESLINSQAEVAYKRLKDRVKISTDTKKTNEIKKISDDLINSLNAYYKKIQQPNPTSAFKWDFVLIDDPSINAFCFPGGKIGVFTGILPIADTEGSLAALLGHEIAHAAAKHSVESLSTQIALNVGISVADIFLGGVLSRTRETIGRTTGIDALQVGVLMPFGRAQESEADYLGLVYSSMAGYDINDSVSLWKNMNAKNKGKEPPQFLSTHPTSSTRIVQLRTWIPEVRSKFPKIES